MHSQLHISWPQHVSASAGDWNSYTDPNLFDNFPNLWFEAHVQHTIGFIKHQVRCATHVGFADFQKIDQSPRSCYADFGTLTAHNLNYSLHVRRAATRSHNTSNI